MAVTTATSMQSAPIRYDRVSIALHWFVAALVLGLWLLAQVWDFFPKHSAGRVALQSLHVSFGLVLAATLVVRIVWRASLGRRLPPANSGLLGFAARAMHLGLYILLGVQVLLGLFSRWLSTEALSFFWLFSIPSPVMPNKALADTLLEIHDTIGTTIVILAALHAAAGLLHHFIWRDGVLERMLFR
ncbi:MAG: cytochrome b/b6 domain-containing protein [Acidobacteriia bacterium]|nr:cytochrome b [Methyloceanibacter sp.]MBX5471044.1 cytochrome b [Acetobacteraceae bacterium]MCL6491412.1 cytochrome b/b6 domain-containing protein [Terriglobia bacterium]